MLNIGILGCGKISQVRHIPEYIANENANLVGLFDLDSQRCEEIAAKYGVKAYASAQELLDDPAIDAVSVCVANFAHADLTIQALKAGKHVLCEKPLAMNVSQALEMQKAVDDAGVIFMLAVPSRFGYENMYLRDMYEKGELGEVYYAKTSAVRRRGTPSGWFTDKKTSGGGPVIDIGIHRIDEAWYLMGNPKPVRVSANVFSKIGDYQTKGVSRWIGTPCPDNRFDCEDSGAGVIHFENGALMVFEASWALNAPAKEETLVCGTKAGATIEPFTIYGERNDYLSTDNITVLGGGEKRFLLEIEHFADCVQKGVRETKYPMAQAVDMQKMLQAIYDSAASGKEILL